MALYDDALNQWQQKKPPVRRVPGQQAQPMAPAAPPSPMPVSGGAPPPVAPPTRTGPAMSPMQKPTYPQGQGTKNIMPGMQPPPPPVQTRSWMDDLMGDSVDRTAEAMGEVGQMGQSAAQSIPEGLSVDRGPLEMPGYMPQEFQDLWNDIQNQGGGADPFTTMQGPADISGLMAGDPSRMSERAPTGELWDLPAHDYRGEYGQGVGDLFNDIFEGGEASFDPQRESIEAGKQDALGRLAEQMASMGFGSSGIEASLGGQIAMDAAQRESEEFQQWYQQQVENKMNAAGMMMQDDWKKMDMAHQEAMAKLMFELDRKRELGDQWESGMGDADMRILMALLTNPELSDSGKNTIEMYMRELMGDEEYENLIKGGGVGDWFPDPEDAWSLDPDQLK